jgi:hypothetical protein
VRRPIAARLRDKTFVLRGGACWIWCGSRRAGYGLIRINSRKIGQAHRVAYEVAHGVTLAASDVVMHKCDNPSCVNPAHLSVGTPKDNAQDMLLKLRISRVVGPDTVLAIRRRWVELGGLGPRRKHVYRQDTIAREFGVSRGTVSDIVRRHTWSHV